MKKIIALAILLICVFGMAACDNESQNETPNGSSSGDTDPVTDEHIHEYGEWTTVKISTCSVKGEEERICSCGSKETQYIDTLPHTEVVDVAVSPTYTSEGKTEGKHCSVCNEVIVRQETIPVLPDVIINDVTIEKKDGVLSVGDTITVNVYVDSHYDVFTKKFNSSLRLNPKMKQVLGSTLKKAILKKIFTQLH